MPPEDTPELRALQQIARGHTQNGRPLGGRDVQEITRRALIEIGADWTAQGSGYPRWPGEDAA